MPSLTPTPSLADYRRSSRERRLLTLRSYSYLLAVCTGIASCGLNMALAFHNYLAQATMLAVYCSVGALAAAIGTWLIVVFDARFHTTQLRLESLLREQCLDEAVKTEFLEQMRKGHIEPSLAISQAKSSPSTH